MYSISLVTLSWLILGERAGWTHLVGGALVVGAVLIGSLKTSETGKDAQRILKGIVLGVVAMLCVAYVFIFMPFPLEE